MGRASGQIRVERTRAFCPDPLGHGQPTLTSVDAVAGRATLLTHSILAGGDILAALLTMTLLQSWAWLAWFHVGATLMVLAAADSYRPRAQLNVLEHLPDLFAKLSGPSLATVAATLFLGKPTPLLLQACFLPIAILIGRAATTLLARRLRAAGRLTEPVVIVGGGSIGAELIHQLQRHPEYGLTPIGYLDDEAAEVDAPHLGRAEDIEELVRGGSVRSVIVAFSSRPEREVVDVLRGARRMGADIAIVPRFFEVGLMDRGPLEELWGIPVCVARREPRQTVSWSVKRVMDVVLSGTLLFASAPLLAAAALAVRLTSPGPVIFRQWRIGQDGKPFQMLKFRSLRVDVDTAGQWDSRLLPVTPVGSFLRRTKIDELPQLWNVLRGDMSLVGPRPEETDWVERFSEMIPGYPARHRLPVGLTGLAQVNGVCGDRSPGSIRTRTRFDNYYIDHWALWRDIAILLRTLPAIFAKGSSSSPRGAKAKKGHSATPDDTRAPQ